MTHRILVQNAHLLTMTADSPVDGLAQILVVDGRISAMGSNLDVSDAHVVDARGAIVMPGMVDTHRHVWQSLLRGQVGDGTLYDYMAKIRYGFSVRHSAEDAELGN